MNKAYSRIVWENAPSVATPLNENNLNKVDVALDEVDDRVVILDGVKANQSDLLQSVKNVEYNEQSGVFKFNYWNGTYFEVDLNIEKIPVSFYMDGTGVITMVTADKTTYTADISKLIQHYRFNDSGNIAFTDETDKYGNINITAEIVKGSITDEHLEGHYLANITLQAQRAEESAQIADIESLEAEGFAVGTQNGVPVESWSPYFANNAKYYSDRASEIAKVDIATTEKAGIVKPDGKSIHVKADGTIDCDGKADNMVYDEDNSLLYLKSGDKVLSSVEISGGSASTVIHVDTHEESWKGNEKVLVEIFDDSKAYQGHFDENGDYFHKVQFIGDHLIRVTDEDGSIFEEHVNVDKLGSIYYVYVEKVTWGYKGWLKSADISTSGYSSLADVLADEKVVRELMTKHASSDYLVSWLREVPTEVDTFIGNDIAMKWIGLRDYVCDKLSKSPNLIPFPYYDGTSKTVNGVTFTVNEDGSVTANGTASGNSFFNFVQTGYVNTLKKGSYMLTSDEDSDAFLVINFNGTQYNEKSGVFTLAEDKTYIMYIYVPSGKTLSNVTFYPMIVEVNADGSYPTEYEPYGESKILNKMLASDHWERILKDHVPIMTSNTTPYGTASASAVSGSDFPAWKAFDGDAHTVWGAGSNANQWICYKFPNPICVKRMYTERMYDLKMHFKSYKIQGSNDGSTWVDVFTDTKEDDDTGAIDVSFPNEEYYLYYRLYVVNTHKNNIFCAKLQFYGRSQVDEYPNYDARTYLYDHGVELETLTITSTSALATVDTTSYSLLRATDVDHASATDKLVCGSAYAKVNGLPNNNYLDISSINGENSVGWGTKDTTYLAETSLWLE